MLSRRVIELLILSGWLSKQRKAKNLAKKKKNLIFHEMSSAAEWLGREMRSRLSSFPKPVDACYGQEFEPIAIFK
jgi:hypothetical protein